MSVRQRWMPAIGAFLYFLASWIVLLWILWADPFCSEHGRNEALLVATRLAIAFTAWDFAACSFGSWASGALETPSLSVLIRTSIVGFGIASIPLWIYRAYGVFHFQNTLIDVTCAYEEGYGIAFLTVVPAVLASFSLLLGWMRVVLQKRVTLNP